MAVKVMLAAALARREPNDSDALGAPLARAAAASPARGAAPSPRPKRRRASVYDCDGNEVFITLMCLKCHKMQPLSHFGLRRMTDGAIRNQPWCRTCRGAAGAPGPKRRRARAEASQAPPAAARPEPVLDPGILAAQVVAALHGGRR